MRVSEPGEAEQIVCALLALLMLTRVGELSTRSNCSKEKGKVGSEMSKSGPALFEKSGDILRVSP